MRTFLAGVVALALLGSTAAIAQLGGGFGGGAPIARDDRGWDARVGVACLQFCTRHSCTALPVALSVPKISSSGMLGSNPPSTTCK